MTKVTMIATKAVLCIGIDDVEYRPDANGEFQIEERHVAELRCHCLILKGDMAPRKTLKEQNAELIAENEKLKAQVAAKNGKATK
jgi:hypothetical protein